MPHPKEHPLAHRVVVPLFATDSNEGVYVVDWLDRLPRDERQASLDAPDAGRALHRVQGEGLHVSGLVAARDGRGRCLVHHAELPAYEFEPVGTVS